MASSVTSRIAKTVLDRMVAGKTYRMAFLVANTTSWQTETTAQAFNVVADVVADEATDGSYARQNITVDSVVENDTDKRGELHIEDTTFPSLAATTGQILGVLIFEVVTNDSDHIIVGIVDVSALSSTPDGNDYIVRQGANGVLHTVTTQ